MAKNQAQQLGAQEAILVDQEGNWLETSTGNLWGWARGCWWTPLLDSRILPGIERSYILERLHQQKLPVRENQWTPEFVQELAMIAYSNSVVEIVPFKTIVYKETKRDYLPDLVALKDLKKS